MQSRWPIRSILPGNRLTLSAAGPSCRRAPIWIGSSSTGHSPCEVSNNRCMSRLLPKEINLRIEVTARRS